MKDFKERIHKHIKEFKTLDSHCSNGMKFPLNPNDFNHYILITPFVENYFNIEITTLPLTVIKEIYALFDLDLSVIRQVLDRYMEHMDNTQLTTSVADMPTFDIENFRSGSQFMDIIIPLKDRNVIANKNTIYTVKKYYEVYPTARVSMKFHVADGLIEPNILISLPLARKERFLVSVGVDYNMEEIDNIIKKAIRQRVICLLTTKRIKTFTKKDIQEAEFEDIGRFMTLLAMDSI